jgi:hypothetical protein
MSAQVVCSSKDSDLMILKIDGDFPEAKKVPSI